MKSCKTIKSNKIYQGHIIALSHDQIEMPDGKVFDRDLVRHPGAVVIVPVENNRTLYMVRQFRYAIQQELLELPAGCLEAGEIPIDCARRELQEEIGMAAASWQELGLIYPAPGFCDEKQHIFYASGFTTSILPGDEDEIIQVVKVELAEITQLIKAGKIQDAKTLAALNIANSHNLLPLS